MTLDFLTSNFIPNLSVKCEDRTKIFVDFSDLKNILMLKDTFF